MNSLLDKHCRDYSKNEAPMNSKKIEEFLFHTPKWHVHSSPQQLSRTYSFENYQQTIDFVNKVAAIAEKHDHHPNMEVSYNRCKVSYNTHTVGGITKNDFICAAQIDATIA